MIVLGDSMKKITVTLHIGGEQVEKLTPEQVQKIADRLSESMSEYYTARPEEFKRMQGSTEKCSKCTLKKVNG